MLCSKHCSQDLDRRLRELLLDDISTSVRSDRLRTLDLGRREWATCGRGDRAGAPLGAVTAGDSAGSRRWNIEDVQASTRKRFNDRLTSIIVQVVAVCEVVVPCLQAELRNRIDLYQSCAFLGSLDSGCWHL